MDTTNLPPSIEDAHQEIIYLRLTIRLLLAGIMEGEFTGSAAPLNEKVKAMLAHFF